MMLTAREAMQRAENAGVARDYESARFWLDFARELREDAQFRKMWTPVSDMTTAAVQEDTTALRLPERRPGEAIEGDGQRCRHCGYFIKWVVTSVPGEPGHPTYVHTRTGQSVCPVGRPGGPDDTMVHTFAEPE